MSALATRKVWLVVEKVVTRPNEVEPAQHSYVNGTKFLSSYLIGEDEANFLTWVVITEVTSDVDPVNFSYTNGCTLISTVFLRDA